MGRIVLFMRASALRDGLARVLVARGAEVLVGAVVSDVEGCLLRGGVRGVVASLDPSPRESGLALLGKARDLAPGARRVLVVDAPSSVSESAYAAGLCDRLLHEGAPIRRAELLADWLVMGWGAGKSAPRVVHDL